jgi:hypothetical protein
VGVIIEEYSRHMRFIASFLISLCLMANAAIADDKAKARELNALARAQGDISEFHAPQTEAEKKLNFILTATGNMIGFTWFAVDDPDRDRINDRLLLPLFSKDLRNSWIKSGKEALKEKCDGEYIEGESCGIGHNPLTCAQDYNEEGYLYKTLAEDDEVAIVSYMWPHIPEIAATFRMIRHKGQWIVDGVSCRERLHPTYNFKF